MNYYAVIDTNVIVAALLSKNEDSATVQILQAVLNGTITPLYHGDILSEYEEVLRSFIVTPAEMLEIIQNN